MFVYLDNSSTTKQYIKVTEYMYDIMKNNFGNPSSVHKLGINAEKVIKEARKVIADRLNATSDEIYFTSGGTEADNTAIFGSVYAKKKQGKKIITSEVEHPAVLEAFRKLESEGFEVVYLPVDKNCQVDVEEYKSHVDDNLIFTSIMTVNNEVGTIEPIAELYKAKSENSIFHTDGVQAYGKVDIPKVDLISISGHKIHGPMGIGALYVKKGLNVKPFIVGGGQEKNFRSGTENVAAIGGFGLASELNKFRDTKEVQKMKDYLKAGIEAEIDDIKINTPENSVDSVLNISFVGTRSEVILHTLEMDDIYVSAGSACSSNKKGQSHVLGAMGLTSAEIEGAIRFSLSEMNTMEEMDYVITKTKEAVKKFRKLGTFR